MLILNPILFSVIQFPFIIMSKTGILNNTSSPNKINFRQTNLSFQHSFLLLNGKYTWKWRHYSSEFPLFVQKWPLFHRGPFVIRDTDVARGQPLVKLVSRKLLPERLWQKRILIHKSAFFFLKWPNIWMKNLTFYNEGENWPFKRDSFIY